MYLTQLYILLVDIPDDATTVGPVMLPKDEDMPNERA